MIDSSLYITTKELALELGVHRTTIVRWINAGIIPAERIGPKFIRVPRTGVANFGELGRDIKGGLRTA